MTNHPQRLIFFAGIALLFACGLGNDADDDPTVNDPCETIEDDPSFHGGITLDQGCFDILGQRTLTEDTLTIGSGATLYFAPQGGLIVKGTLDIRPGARLFFAEDAGLEIDGGILLADADPGAPILFHGYHEVAGHWRGIRITNSETTSSMTHVEIRHGGSQIWVNHDSESRTNLLIDQGGILTLNQAQITDSAHMGISLIGGALHGCQDLHFFNTGHHDFYVEDPLASCLD